jgi:hypothetical protein
MTAAWPELPYAAWQPTRDTLHMKLQIVGKVRLALAPFEPQWGEVALYITARGLTTSPMPHPGGVFDIEVDLVDHAVLVRTVEGAVERVALRARPVAEFHAELLEALQRAGRPVEIAAEPSEVADPIPFAEDTVHRAYEPEWANRWWRVLVEVEQVMREFRAHFMGRSSMVHFFWGSFDLAVTRFNGAPAEPPPGSDLIMRESANAEQICAGFWPGSERFGEPAFFAYAYPAPDGIADAPVRPDAAAWNADLGEFVLPYEAVRTAGDPRRALLDFLESTYAAGARLRGWDPQLVKG